jgi:hypothetical protein
LIALIVTSTYGYLLLRGISVPSVLINSAVVVIAFYFGSRAGASPPTPSTPGAPPPRPTAAPRRTKVVRGTLFLAFVGLAAWFLRTNPSWNGLPPELRSVLEVLAGYVSGMTVSWLIHRRARETTSRRRIATIARDLLAAGSLALTAYACYGLGAGVMTVFGDRTEGALSLVVTFYFGSRVISH